MAKAKKPRTKKYNPLKHAIREGDLPKRVASSVSTEIFDEGAARIIIEDLEEGLEKTRMNTEESTEWFYLFYRRILLTSFVARRCITDIKYNENEDGLDILHKMNLSEANRYIKSTSELMEELLFNYPERNDWTLTEEQYQQLSKTIEHAEYVLFRCTLGAVMKGALDTEDFLEKVIYKHYKKDPNKVHALFEVSPSLCEICRYQYPRAMYLWNFGKYKDSPESVSRLNERLEKRKKELASISD